MDLRTYAISQKLKQNSDLWLYIADGRDVPISVVESAFSKILNDTNDLEAERLANDYDSYVTNHIPLTVSPLDGGAQINGELDDRALDVIQHFYNYNAEDVVRHAIRHTIEILSPHRPFEVTDIQLVASELHRRVRENHRDILRHLQPTGASDVLVDDNPAEIRHEVKSVSSMDALYKAQQELEHVLENVRQNDPQPSVEIPILAEPDGETLESLPELSDIEPLPTLPTLQGDGSGEHLSEPIDNPQPKNEETVPVEQDEMTEAGLTASMWNSFITDLKESGLADRLDLEVPLSLAVV